MQKKIKEGLSILACLISFTVIMGCGLAMNLTKDHLCVAYSSSVAHPPPAQPSADYSYTTASLHSYCEIGQIFGRIDTSYSKSPEENNDALMSAILKRASAEGGVNVRLIHSDFTLNTSKSDMYQSIEAVVYSRTVDGACPERINKEKQAKPTCDTRESDWDRRLYFAMNCENSILLTETDKFKCEPRASNTFSWVPGGGAGGNYQGNDNLKAWSSYINQSIQNTDNRIRYGH
jgi:hypothetical protein